MPEQEYDINLDDKFGSLTHPDRIVRRQAVGSIRR